VDTGDACASDGQTTVYEAFARTRARWADRPFLHIPAHCAGGQIDLTYEQAAEAVTRIAGVYRRAGFGAGHHVALWLDNRADFYLHWLALSAIGATLIPLGAELTPEEAGDLLERADVDLLIHLPERRDAASRAAYRVGTLALATPGAFSSRHLAAASVPRSAGDPTNAAAIVFTSGSTGQPKGCILPNEYFLAFGRWYRDLGGRCTLRPSEERLLTPLPLNHVNALAFSSMGMILTGGCIVQLDRFRPSIWWSTVSDAHATVMHYLGVMPAMLLQLPPEPREQTHSLRFGFGGGVRSTHHASFEERFRVPLIEAWAMTETGGAGTLSTHVGPRNVGSGCIGQPSPQYSEATIASESGALVEAADADRVGELLVRAAGSDPHRGFFGGYYKDQQATAAAWEGGWLHTGDLARRAADGTFFFVGRRKQIIRRSGENISAAEVEAALGAQPCVKEVAVVPVPDDLREEEVFACIVAEPDSVPSDALATAILAGAGERLAYFKLPGYIAFVDSLPVTATQKLRYGAVSELAHTLLHRGSPQLFDLRNAKRKLRSAH
jgi:acyl-CoA synthetase (AMP-forming)/AMP-acid ligase II